MPVDMTVSNELLLIEFDPPLHFTDWITIKQNAVADGTASHMNPHFCGGQLIGIRFDNPNMAVMFRLSTTYTTKI